MGAPRPRLIDHLRVASVLVLTLFGIVPFAIWAILVPILKPWVTWLIRRRFERPTPALAEPQSPDPKAWAGRTVFVVAGEASGDQLAARVVRAMKARCPALRVRGYAGPQTAAAGAELDRDIVQHAVFGILPVIRSVPTWWGVMAEFLALLREERPDVVLTVDFPGLNGRLARWAKQAGIPAIHLVPPSVWAYAPWRVFRWRRAVNLFLAVFPFEPKLYLDSGIPCTFVGHPLFEAPLAPPRTPAVWPGKDEPWVELLPGSRRQEIQSHAGLLLDAAGQVEDALPGTRFRVRLASAEHAAFFESAAAGARRRPTTVEFLHGPPPLDEAEPLLGAIACSGTVTAELGAALVPMAIVYRLHPVTRLGAWLALTTPWFGLVNLIAGTTVAPECLQSGADGTRVARAFLDVVASPETWMETRAMLEARVRTSLETRDVADRAACALFETATALGAHRP